MMMKITINMMIYDYVKGEDDGIANGNRDNDAENNINDEFVIIKMAMTMAMMIIISSNPIPKSSLLLLNEYYVLNNTKSFSLCIISNS